MATAQSADPQDLATAALERLVPVLCEDGIFALAGGGHDAAGSLEGLARRRSEAYNAVLAGTPVPRMRDQFDTWFIQVTRGMAAVAPPAWMPMMDVVREKVSLEVGARGLRSLFSSKPSEKDVARVRRFGPLAVRVLRAVFASDGPLDVEETMHVNALIASLGLPDVDAQPLKDEGPLTPERFDMYLDIEPAIAKAIVAGGWLAAVQDHVDPREEQVLRVIAHNVGAPPELIEEARAEAQSRVDARRAAGLATVDAVRYILADRVPGIGVQIPAIICTLVLPRRYRDEALAHIGHGTPVNLSKRHAGLTNDARVTVLGIAWAAALAENPSIARTSLLRSRWERVAVDLGEESSKARTMVDEWLAETLGTVAKAMK